MKMLVRAALGLTLLLGLTLEVAALKRGAAASDDVAALTAPVTALGLTVTGISDDAVLSAAAPGCDKPVRAALLGLDGAQDWMVPSVLGPGMVARYVFMGDVADRPSRWRMDLQWAGNGLSALVGRATHRRTSNYILVGVPAGCPALLGLDWAKLSPTL